MRKNIFAVCDLDESYAKNLTDYLNEKKNTPFEVQAFTDVECLQNFAEEQPIELLLISTRAMNEQIRETNVERIIILSEGEPLREQNLEGYPFVYKYQSSDQLLREIMDYYSQMNPNTTIFPAACRTKLIGVYSPVSRCGKTTFSLAMGEILAESKQVLYLNLEEHSGFEELFHLRFNMDITDLIYFARQKEDNLIFKLNAVIQSFHGLQYIPPALFSADLRDVTGEEWISFLKEVITYCEYDIILLDLGSQIDELFQILQLCNHIYMPVQDDWISQTKILQYEKLVSMMEMEDILKKTEKLHVPVQTIRKEEDDPIYKMVRGEMGNYVRGVLKGSFYE